MPSRTSKLLAFLCIAVSLPAMAQLPAPYRSSELRGRVVDDATGQPLEGAIVVARWDWLDYTPPRFHGGDYYLNNGAVHVGEAVTDRAGEYRIPAWGPVVKTGGKMEENQPRLFAFKPGYEPLVAKRDEALRLKKSTVPPAEYAQLIAKFQQGTNSYGGAQGAGTLAWRSPNDDWRGMPRMVAALHREKVRLGGDGAKILGANLLNGRSGEGLVLDPETKQPVQFAVASITWTLRRSDGSPGEKRIVQTKWAGSKLWVSPWRNPVLGVPGWEIATDAVPVVRVYAPGYRRSADIRWPELGTAITMQKLPQGRDAIVAELGTWKRDVDSALAMDERQVTLPLQRALLSSLAHQCNQLTADLRADICFSPGSDVARYVEETRNTNIGQEMETDEGTVITRVIASSAGGSAIQAQSVAIAPSRRIDRPSIGGFRIEPAR